MDDDSMEMPDFVHAERVEEISDNLIHLTFEDGFEFYTLANVFEAELLYNEISVVQEYTHHGITLKNAKCVIDAGANIGLFTLFAKSQCPQTTIYAFEPMVETFELLQRNVTLHALDNVHLYNAALGSRDGIEREFTYFPNMTANSTASPESKESFQQSLSEWRSEEEAAILLSPISRVAKVRTLSAFLTAEKIRYVDLLKLDVEGDELEVLKGIDVGHWGIIKQIAAEIHSDELAEQCQAYLREVGYQVSQDDGVTSTIGCSYLYAIRA